MDFRSKLNEDVAKNFATDSIHHQIKILHNDGLYRHFRCGNPETVFNSFHIVTWPGHLCFTGDRGDFLFRRIDDMLEFFNNWRSFEYMAEKCLTYKHFVRKFYRELVDEHIEDQVKYYTEEDSDIKKLQILDDIKENINHLDYESEFEIYKEFFESGLYDEMPEFEYFTSEFLYCLHAIGWFILKREM